MDYSSHVRDWEDLGELDPLWAILSDPGRQHGSWDLDEFMQTGRHEIARALRRGADFDLPGRQKLALDFGCGVGRLTLAIADSFEAVVGTDISSSMLAMAHELNSHPERNVEFVRTEPGSLARFDDETFDFVYSGLVLQHLPSRQLILELISELVRVSAAGGLVVFQVPAHLPIRRRIQLRGRAFRLLRRIGFSPGGLYRRFGLQPIRMNFVSTKSAAATVKGAGGRVLAVDHAPSFEGSNVLATYFVTRVVG